MTISIKTADELQKMRVAGKLAAEVLEMIAPHVVPGVSTGELDRLCAEHITIKQEAISACLNYGPRDNPFPKSVCISINEVVCHGIPTDERILKNGDIVNIDVTVIKDGYFGDTSKMFIVGEGSILAKRLCKITQESLYKAIRIVKPGIRLKEIGEIIQPYAESERFSVVRDFCGHGIGNVFHEEPQVLHYAANDGGVILQPGMTFTIEPMLNAGDYRVRIMKDGWTVKTKDRSLSAQYEHTLAVTETGCEVFTLREEEDFPAIIHH
ncbi:type I methionyl aminopeptidase [Thorsellia anophelis]|uniref:Methionine aminopeptidase n=1 Tax=Thorsellia anophelis DSM 18579 TaxID=1123402 RepID=A0A1I0EF62_9GAMM|nr:type I methionyl aminopeptidase [Thorsellia anophelis]SET43478.1 methionyl aminopeptidase [Thorsellia anophelis DSM 18579]